MRAAIEADFRGFVRQFAPRIFKQGDTSPLLAWAIAQMQKTPAHAAAACFDALVAADLRPVLKKLAVPTAVLHGRHDALFPIADVEKTVKGLKGAAFTVFEESGHAPHLEEPDAFNAALPALLAR
jgi:pimeloyl-ACP methyl ester carboxylesterase